MARWHGNRPTVSLFPFLSILVCLMGVLAFITVAVALLSATNPTVTLSRSEASDSPEKSKKPVFVECHEDRLVIHPRGEEVAVAEVAAPDSPFMRLLDRLHANREQEYVIFAVFPSGLPCFYEGRNLVESRGIDLGFEPMLGGWRLDPGEAEGSAP